MEQTKVESVVSQAEKLIIESGGAEFCLVPARDLRLLVRKSRERDQFYEFIQYLRDSIPRQFREFFQDYPDGQ